MVFLYWLYTGKGGMEGEGEGEEMEIFSSGLSILVSFWRPQWVAEESGGGEIDL
jgi:hypothetical protein